MYRDYVSAGRVSALWDEHRYWTRRMLWQYCRDGSNPQSSDGNQRARSGRELEPGILAMAAQDLGAETIHLPQGPEHLVRHAGLPLACVADGLVLHPEHGLGLVSAKAVSWRAWADLWAPMKNGVPRSYELQLQAELLCWSDPIPQSDEVSNLIADHGLPTWGCVAAMNDLDITLYSREPERALHDQMAAEVLRFVDSVESGEAPALSYTSVELPLIQQLYPLRGDKFETFDIDDPDDVAAFDTACEQYLEARTLTRTADDLRDEAKGRIHTLAEGNRFARGSSYQCKLTQVDRKPSFCPHCSEEIRAGYSYILYSPKEL